MTSILAGLFAHHHWANLRLIDHCANLYEEQLTTTVPGTFGSIRETLLHVVLNEVGYLAPLGVLPPDDRFRWGMDFPGFALLRERADWTGQRFAELAAGSVEDDLVRGEYQGRPFAIPRSIFFTQAINHATEHRTQIKTILTQLGIEPPDLDGWTYDEDAANRG
jgi:uncharacterized damage-inducible protein DinB